MPHGCGEAFPLIDTGDGQNEARNRRVELFLFEDGIKPQPAGEVSEAGSEAYPAWRRRVVAVHPYCARGRRRLETSFALDVFRHAASQLSDDGFVHWIHAMFGSDVPTVAARRLRADLSGLEHPPTYVVDERISNHVAAYDSFEDCILLHDSLFFAIAKGEAQGWLVAAILLEEFGHHIDDLLRTHYSDVGGDALGDEGRRLAMTLFSVPWEDLPETELAVWNRQPIMLDWRTLRQELAAEDVSATASVDAREGNLEFHNGAGGQTSTVEIGDNRATLTGHAPEALYPSFAAYARDSREARAIERYFAFAHTMSIYGIVEVARKLSKRLDGAQSGLFAESFSASLDVRARLSVLQSLKRLYEILDARFRAAPLDADGLPSFSDKELGHKTDDATVLFLPRSPLAGIVEDVSPFGSIDSWVVELNTTRLPPVPSRPARDEDEFQWPEPPSPEPEWTLDPERDAVESLVDLSGSSGRVRDTAEAAKAPSFDSVNRTATIVDGLWGQLGELVPVIGETVGVVGAIGIMYWQLSITLSEVDAKAVQQATWLGLEVGAKAISYAAGDPKLVVGSHDMNAQRIVAYIGMSHPLQVKWETRNRTPAKAVRKESAENAIEKLATAFRTALLRTELVARNAAGYERAPTAVQHDYMQRVRAKVYMEFSAAALKELVRAKQGLTR